MTTLSTRHPWLETKAASLLGRDSEREGKTRGILDGNTLGGVGRMAMSAGDDAIRLGDGRGTGNGSADA